MKLIWSYEKRNGRCDIESSYLERYYFITSILSISSLFLEAEKVLNCNRDFYKLIQQWELESLFDTVRVVDYEKELYSKYGVSFYAYPKVESMLRQTEPFWILDTDRVVLSSPKVANFLVNFDTTNYYGEIYPHTWVRKIQPVGLKGYPEDFKSFFSRQKAVNGGFIYYPDSNVAKTIALALLSLVKDLKIGDEIETGNFMFYEEVPILNIVEIIGKQFTDTHELLDFLPHPSHYRSLNHLLGDLEVRGKFKDTGKILGVGSSLSILTSYPKAFEGYQLKLEPGNSLVS